MTIDWRRLLRRYLQVTAFCCVLAVLTSAIWPRGYWVQLGYSLCVGTLTWVFIETGRLLIRRPKDPGRWRHGPRGLLLTVVGIALGFYFGGLLGDALFGLGMVSTGRDRLISTIITVSAGVVGSYFFYTRGERALLSAKINAAERDAAEARLQLLAMQLEPHMLFNTLANLRVLISADPPRAIAMLDRLDSYLRATLQGSRTLAHPLSAEFTQLDDYLALMAIRMGPRLAFRLELPDALRTVPVPPLLLQPLVENSIRHGLEPKVDGGEISVRAHQVDKQIVIDVRDTGVGAGAIDKNPGFGLTQVRERLATLYGAQGTLTLSEHPDGGMLATVRLPFTPP